MPFEVLSKTRVVEGGFISPDTPLKELEKGCYMRISHKSTSTGTQMIFGLFLPSNYNLSSKSTSIIYWLSGLTCDDTNFAIKAGSKAFEAAERKGLAIVMPDTSPRNDDTIPNVDSYDLGIGAGFYVDATMDPYKKHYKMYSYITEELPTLLENELNLGKDGQKSICGHSMGGHGALTIALKQGPSMWKSVSAFAPICNPTKCPWGEKAFSAYFGSVEEGRDHDASCLISKEDSPIFDNILIDQGTADQFLKDQLNPSSLDAAAKQCGQRITINLREGFDHSYFFIAAFIDGHIDFHSKYLN